MASEQNFFHQSVLHSKCFRATSLFGLVLRILKVCKFSIFLKYSNKGSIFSPKNNKQQFLRYTVWVEPASKALVNDRIFFFVPAFQTFYQCDNWNDNKIGLSKFGKRLKEHTTIDLRPHNSIRSAFSSLQQIFISW